VSGGETGAEFSLGMKRKYFSISPFLRGVAAIDQKRLFCGDIEQPLTFGLFDWSHVEIV
jgi:hypothetical protein